MGRARTGEEIEEPARPSGSDRPLDAGILSCHSGWMQDRHVGARRRKVSRLLVASTQQGRVTAVTPTAPLDPYGARGSEDGRGLKGRGWPDDGAGAALVIDVDHEHFRWGVHGRTPLTRGPGVEVGAGRSPESSMLVVSNASISSASKGGTTCRRVLRWRACTTGLLGARCAFPNGRMKIVGHTLAGRARSGDVVIGRRALSARPGLKSGSASVFGAANVRSHTSGASLTFIVRPRPPYRPAAIRTSMT